MRVLIVPLTCFLVLAGHSAAGEAVNTTWRPDDIVHYRSGCHDQEAALQTAESGDMATAVWIELMRSGRCFILTEKVPAQLVKWVAGPYTLSPGIDASVWQVRDALGDETYILLDDEGGPHLAALDI